MLTNRANEPERGSASCDLGSDRLLDHQHVARASKPKALPLMSSKGPRIAELIESHRGQSVDPHYLGFFDCFNRQLYFEAHEVLEELWLEDRLGSNGAFYKGLIQLAGAFVHRQKNRSGPAAALLRLAQANLKNYGPVHEQFDVAHALVLMQGWLAELQVVNPGSNSIPNLDPPRLRLLGSASDQP
jgi:Domain of unknown function (DUF309)